MRVVIPIVVSLIVSITTLYYEHFAKADFDVKTSNDGIVTDGSYTVESLIKDVFVKGSCETVSNIQAIGNLGGIGYFENGDSVVGLDRGIILSTGPIANAHGPNSDTGYSGSFMDNSGDMDLGLMATGDVYDAVGIEFDFIPLDSFVAFRYVFASDEYCEFVGSEFNDVFGFFISGPGIDGDFSNSSKNVALVPGTSDFVAINSINHVRNSNFFVRNERMEDADECNISHVPSELQERIEYDGLTKGLTALLRLIPCETYHIRFVVSDVADNFYDSAVFLEAGSFNIGGEVKLSARTENQMDSDSIVFEGCSDGYFVFERADLDKIDFPLTVGFKVADISTAIEGIDFDSLPSSITIPAGDVAVRLPINAINDQNPEPFENLALELDIPCACYTGGASLIVSDAQPIVLEMPDRVVCENDVVELEAIVSQGSPPYAYQWNTGDTTTTIDISTNVPTRFSVTVTDLCGNVVDRESKISVTQPPEAVLSGQQEVCEGEMAQLQIDFTGTPPFSFQYYVNGAPRAVMEDIFDNPYLLEVDEDGEYELQSFQDAICEGFASGIGMVRVMRIELSGTSHLVSCYGASDGHIQLNITGGTPPYSFIWDADIPDVEDPQGLPAGDYQVFVQDARGCYKYMDFNVSSPPQLEPAGFSCPDLRNGIINIEAGGGTPPYRYSVDGGQTFLDKRVFLGLTPGETYDLIIEDATLCTREQTFLMPAPTNKMIEIEPELILKLGDPGHLDPLIRVPESLIDRIVWLPADQLSCSDCMQPTIIPLADLKYTVRLIDKFGCKDESVIDIKVNKQVDMFIPTAFSPNGDGTNDIFTILANSNQIAAVRRFQIYDRWGNLLFQMRDFLPNNPHFGWDGNLNGAKVAAGVFVYVIESELVNGTIQMTKGDVLLIR